MAKTNKKPEQVFLGNGTGIRVVGGPGTEETQERAAGKS